MLEFKEWKHVFKLDPNKEINDEELEAICESGTDGLIIGGTDGVTLDNTLQLLARVRRYSVSAALEISNLEAITPGFDYYFIPSVMNSQSVDWIQGLHHQAIKEYGAIMNWDEIVMEGYCILNPEAKAAKVTEANTDIDVEDVVAYARMAENLYRFPIFYIEYSGTYGDPSLVHQVKNVLNETKLVYGGGIHSLKEAQEMADAADMIVVGNIIYEDLRAALETVKATKS
ncbi:heptaprenylglyceryl phosphate synthase [Alkalihalophilus marmarensis]|jgi:putative glycerol-1-phosphate prenyltransferase|uniref:Heptaprenylglyceryl phosphate synthase n=1 Tax=Alkalihalophilus marmarensis DSM 21297 TaxID=1188261 RepID=U6SKE9_9BACI|nr:heptaprenylglyceryl phosphate synthase [Alkalihalophilus marmarensis]ERN51375.1 geranylgeranylglyceryl phosphate synthase [Alkalihalophilus marmarensis DSM 21297]MCM3490409.1 heptaprenylglyceryl phosphate synthase [Alkalihalophilus marmarensis]